jgi:CheY-like chemotaxis protein
MPGMVPNPAFTILVVDECPAVRVFVELAVGADTVQVIGVRDSYAALTCLDLVRPDLVLADDVLAGLAVPDFLDTVRRRGVPVESARPLQSLRLRDLVSRMHASADPVEAWMGTADAGLATVSGWWRRAAADAGFTGDVEALRARPTRDRLVIRASVYFD